MVIKVMDQLEGLLLKLIRTSWGQLLGMIS